MFDLSTKALTWIVGVTAFSALISAAITFAWYELDSDVTRIDVIRVALFIPMICAPLCTYLGIRSREKIERLAIENERLANTDALTGLANRRAFFDHLAKRYEERSEAEHPITYIVCDVDNFKRFNDAFGHAIGDAVLVHIAALIEQVLPQRAFVARIGGEEFAIRYDSRARDAEIIADVDRMVDTIATTPLMLNGSAHNVTVSIGIFVGTNHTLPERALASADKAMYQAKSNGRNQFVRAA